MATTINADDGVSSGSAGLKESADSSGVLALQTNGTTAVSISTGQVVTLTNALPVGSGGTGLTSAGANGNILTSNGTTWTSAAPTAATGVPVLRVYVSPGTWTKPATVKAIKVTVVGGGGSVPSAPANANGTASGGGGGGSAIKNYPAPTLPGPQPYTVGTAGNTSSFGVSPVTVVSATGGSAGTATTLFSNGGAGGTGSNGDLNVSGGSGTWGASVENPQPISPTFRLYPGAGGTSLLGVGGASVVGAPAPAPLSVSGNAGLGYGGGGSGGRGTSAGGSTGATGVVIVEEFY